MDALANCSVCKKSQLALAAPTDPVGPDTLSAGENRQVLHWSVTPIASLCTARGRSTHRSLQKHLKLWKLRQKTTTSMIYTSGNSCHIG